MKPLVIKLGGAILSEASLLDSLFKTIKKSTRTIVIVHGGGIQVDSLLEKLNFKTERINGLRVTPEEQIPYIVGALAGTASKTLQSYAQKNSLNALVLSLSDGHLCSLTQLEYELGHVADAKAEDPKLLQQLMEQGYLVIINSIGLTDDGLLMNVNADDAAVAVAHAIDAELVFLSNVPGVLDEQHRLIEALDTKKAQKLIEQNIIHSGMAIKVNAALDAAHLLGSTVYIATWEQPDALFRLLQGKCAGTQFTPYDQF